MLAVESARVVLLHANRGLSTSLDGSNGSVLNHLTYIILTHLDINGSLPLRVFGFLMERSSTSVSSHIGGG